MSLIASCRAKRARSELGVGLSINEIEIALMAKRVSAHHTVHVGA